MFVIGARQPAPRASSVSLCRRRITTSVSEPVQGRTVSVHFTRDEKYQKAGDEMRSLSVRCVAV
jgi:hypothetical protein